jgi:hypothetical protein
VARANAASVFASVARHLERVAETGAAPDDRHLVVVDVNVYLDLARLIGPAFSWNAFDALMEIQASEPNPHRSDARIDSLKAIASLRLGRSPSNVPTEVWTSDHINLTAAFKLSQAIDSPDVRDRGLGWSKEVAQHFIDEAIWGLVDQSEGDSVGEIIGSYGSPPLDHEDGRVLATARDAGFMHAGHYDRYILTRDRGFLSATIPGVAIARQPADWVDRYRGEARAVALKRLLGR